MTYFLYRQPNGQPDVSEFELNLEMFEGYQLVSTSEERPDVVGKWFNDGIALTDSFNPLPNYVLNRKKNYPPVGDQLDAIWHAMDKGVLPMVEPFYSDIKTVKDSYPKPSN